MSLSIVEPATAFPVTVEATRDFLRYPHDDQDSLIEELIGAAVEHIQQAASRQFVQAELVWSARDWPGDVISLPRSPVLSIEAVRYRDRDGNVIVLTENDDYLVDLAAEPVTIEPVKSWPRVGDHPAAVEVQFIAGYPGDGGEPEDLTASVPERAKVAIKTLVAHFFENREPVVPGLVSEVPRHVGRLINGLKVWR